MSGLISSAGSKSGIIGTTELDYEEGTWTPTNATLAPSSAVGTYKKIGNIVHFWATFTSNAGGTSSNNWGGLPFPVTNSQNCRSIGTSSYSAIYGIMGDVNATTFSFYSGYSAISLTAGVGMYFGGSYSTG